jgi:hypothetical protein
MQKSSRGTSTCRMNAALGLPNLSSSLDSMAGLKPERFLWCGSRNVTVPE